MSEISGTLCYKNFRQLLTIKVIISSSLKISECIAYRCKRNQDREEEITEEEKNP